MPVIQSEAMHSANHGHRCVHVDGEGVSCSRSTDSTNGYAHTKHVWNPNTPACVPQATETKAPLNSESGKVAEYACRQGKPTTQALPLLLVNAVTRLAHLRRCD